MTTENTTSLAVRRTFPVRPYDLGYGDLVGQECFLRWTADLLQVSIEQVIPMEQLLEGFTMPLVRETSMIHREPLRALDKPEAEGWFETIGATEFVYRAQFELHGVVVATIRQRGLFVDTVSQAPTRAPARLRDLWRRPTFSI